MLSVFDMFKIGIGPSSSHTMGPMVAGNAFAGLLESSGVLLRVARVQVDLYGSLALAGAGHGTARACLSGLEGNVPKTVDISRMRERFKALSADGDLLLTGAVPVPFACARDMRSHSDEQLPYHPNGLVFSAYDSAGECLLERKYYSIGGGLVVSDDGTGIGLEQRPVPPYPFSSGDELFGLCKQHNKTVAQIVMENEKHWKPEEDILRDLKEIVEIMWQCIEEGCTREGVLPGGLKVKRRAPGLLRRIVSMQAAGRVSGILPWATLYALAVAEENAAGSRVVTAPTNGASGIVPAVAMYYKNFVPGATEQGVVDFLLTAGAIGILYQMNASISGAEVGCQGEVGVACSMAAGAFCAVNGGTVIQIENAAEIAMEHNLGLTCDPVGGMVQIPCIERNGLAASRALNSAMLAMMEEGSNRVISLDQVIRVMFNTGKDMQAKYRETALGGLAETIGQTLGITEILSQS